MTEAPARAAARAAALGAAAAILAAACEGGAAAPDAARADGAADAAGGSPRVTIETLPEPPVGSPFPIVLRAAGGARPDGEVSLAISGAPRPVRLHRGLGSAGARAASAGALEIVAGQGPDAASRTVTATARPERALGGTLAGAALAWGADADVRLGPAGAEVPAGATLRLAAGARVLLEPGASLVVRGRLESAGTAAEPVLFTSAPGHAAWGGLRVLGPGASAELAHTWLLAGGGDASLVFGHSASQPVVYVEDGALTMTGGGVLDGPGKALGALRATVALDGALVSRCDTGGELVDSESTIVGAAFLEIPDGDGVLADDDNDALYVRGARTVGAEVRASLIRDTLFAAGEDDGIDHNEAQLVVERAWIQGFAHEGVAASSGREVRIVDSVVLDCEQGIEAGYGAPSVVVEHSLVSGCDVGLRYGDSYDWEVRGTLAVTGTIAVGNGVNVRNHVNALGGPAPAGAIAIACSMIDDPAWDDRDGNLGGAPAWDADGCLLDGSAGAGAACDGLDVGPRGCP